MGRHPNQVLFTFDVEGLPPTEDSFDNASLMCLSKIVDLLDEKSFKGIFFLTGSAAEEVGKHPDLAKRLSSHEIGYHSSSHSIKPRIIEYTDLPNYQDAVAISLERETSHINPKTGKIEGEGGILALRKTFPRNEIVSFRAPFFGWSPPHLEALKKLGIKYDFSSNISKNPSSFKEITFYPSPIPIDDCLEATFVRKEPTDVFPQLISRILLRRKVTVLLMHPPTMLVKNPCADRDQYQFAGKIRTKFIISLLKFLIARVDFLQKTNLIEVTSTMNKNWPSPILEKKDVEKIYWQSVQSLMRLFNSNPRFILSHFMHFFDQDGQQACDTFINKMIT